MESENTLIIESKSFTLYANLRHWPNVLNLTIDDWEMEWFLITLKKKISYWTAGKIKSQRKITIIQQIQNDAWMSNEFKKDADWDGLHFFELRELLLLARSWNIEHLRNHFQSHSINSSIESLYYRIRSKNWNDEAWTQNKDIDQRIQVLWATWVNKTWKNLR